MSQGVDTFPKYLSLNRQRWGDTRTAMRKKELGVWRKYTWKDYYEKVKYFSLGLISLGFERGDRISILGDNDPQWFWAEVAAQSAGGIAAGIFSDSLPQEVKYIAEHSDSKFVVVQDQEQVDKLLQVKDELPLVKKVIYWDTKGMRHYDDPILISFDEVLKLGREYDEGHPELFERNVAQGQGDDIALFLYTSGTTGLPKAAMLDYNYFRRASASLFAGNPVYQGDEFLSFTLPGWIAEQANGLATSMQRGMIMNFPEEQETVQENMREIAPNVLLYPSRLWEGVVSTIQVRISDAPWYKRLIYNLCMPIGYKVADISIEGKKPNLLWRFLYSIGELVMFRPLRDKHGLIRTRIPYSAGAVLGPDILRFFRAIGLKLRQLYGITEASVPSAHTEQEMKFESVGPPLPGVILRLSEEGEILVEKGTCFRGYHKDVDATERVMDSQGWYHTRDAGYIDEDGHLIYIDRIEDMRQLSDGTKFSPQYIESRLKFSPYIKDAFAIGGKERDFVGTVISIDFQNVGNWAEKKHLPYTTFVDLSQKPEVCQLILSEIQKLNRTLPERSRVKGFVNLHKEFDADEAELTRTRKLRRTFVEDRYKELAEAIYGEREELLVSASVVYRDGRKGVVSTTIRVTHVE